ncbi:glycosyltransferase family 1 protein [Candidatus Peribacteria bacterium]|nr:glycosyltransferase family 1 protein [Candidatus Peribacteria bacterium]
MSGSKRCSIGMIVWDYTPSIGGMGRHVAGLVSGLIAAGHSVSVFSRFDLPLPFGRSILFSFLLPFFLPRWAKKLQPDILHVHAGPGGVFLLRKPKRCPLVVTANHTYADQARIGGQQWKRVLVPLERRTYRLADSILCISEDTAESLVRDYGIARDKLSVVHCGIDVARFSRSDCVLLERKRSCVFIGRHDRRKGFDLLEAAWKIVAKKVPDAHLSVVGVHGHDTSSCSFHSSLTDSELPKLLGASMVVVCPSRLEGFGLAAAEAIASGTPVVATDVLGLRSVVRDGSTGLLTSLDPRDITEKLILLLTDDTVWERLHLGCRKHRGELESVLEIERHRVLYLRYTASQ